MSEPATRMTNVVHLIDSPFFGGPERQMLGLARNLPSSYTSFFLCFHDDESSRPFLSRLADHQIAGAMLRNSNPRLPQIVAEVKNELRRLRADVLRCHGYKADVLGWLAGRWAGVSVVGVSRGWTSHTAKVRLYETLDRRVLARMDAVVCVSRAQADKVRRAGIRGDRIHVIRNAIDPERFGIPDEEHGRRLRALFPAEFEHLVCAVGRLSPEKGFDQLIEAARSVVQARPKTGFLLIGDGPQRTELEAQISEAGLREHVVLTGFRSDVDRLLPHVDVVAVPSFTEGLPNVILEAFCAGVPVVATSVGGTPEVVENGVNGYLVPAGDAASLAQHLLRMLDEGDTAQGMGARGRDYVRRHFHFARQSNEYQRLFERLVPAHA